MLLPYTVSVGRHHTCVCGLQKQDDQQCTHECCQASSHTRLCFCRYLFFVGMLMSQFTITGFDACAHMSEETKGADKSAAWAIVMAISTSAIAGWGYLLALLFSIQVAIVICLPAA